VFISKQFFLECIIGCFFGSEAGINMENCHFKFKRTHANLLLAFFRAFLPKSIEVKKYDFGQNVW
jgi:hypothetical protein